jgi:plastocyanin
MRRPAVVVIAGLALALGVLAAPASSQHGGHAGGGPAIGASIGFDRVTPQHLDVLVGDAVTWMNDSVRTHTVTADDASFDSGRLGPSETFTRAFPAPGQLPYHCILHPFIRGEVDVHRLLLTPPAQPAASNRPFPLSGRASLTGGGTVTIEADHGAGFVPVATATPADDGSFVVPVVPGTTATYRAVAGAEASPPVSLLVLDRRVAVRVERGRQRVVIRTSVRPASAGAHVVLQLFLHDHFGWWPVQRTKLDRGSAARFGVRSRRRVAARVVLTLPDGATPLAISPTVRLGPTATRR